MEEIEELEEREELVEDDNDEELDDCDELDPDEADDRDDEDTDDTDRDDEEPEETEPEDEDREELPESAAALELELATSLPPLQPASNRIVASPIMAHREMFIMNAVRKNYGQLMYRPMITLANCLV
ncbi:MAG: hypothetical protein ABUL58_02555 [Steroidobacter sp.]